MYNLYDIFCQKLVDMICKWHDILVHTQKQTKCLEVIDVEINA